MESPGPIVLDEARRVMELQRALLESHVSELRNVVRLCIAVLAGVLAALGLIGQAGWLVSGTAIALATIGMGLVFVAAMRAVHVGFGASTDIEVTLGPDLDGLVARLVDPRTTAREVTIMLARGQALQFEAAAERLASLARAGRTVVRLLLAGATTSAFAMALIVGGAIQ